MSAPLLERLRAARLDRQRRFPDLDSQIKGTIGLHSTDYGSPYLSAWARLAEFHPEAMFQRLNTGQGLFRVNCLRNTVHVVHQDDLAMVLAATGEAVTQIARRSPGVKEVSDQAFERGIDALCAALAEGPQSNNALKAALPDQAENLRTWLIAAMGRGAVIRADAPHARSNRTRYALTQRWVPGHRPWEHGAAEARRQLLARAVRSFGPLTEADLSWWLPAPKGEVSRALASLGSTVNQIEVEGTRYWFSAELADHAPPARETHGAWLLPYEDALLKGYQDRGWLLAPGLREVLFPFTVQHWHPPDGVSPGPGPHKGANVSGEARPSIWWRGRVVGRWEQRESRVLWQLHAPLEPDARAAITAEVARLERFLVEGLAPIS